MADKEKKLSKRAQKILQEIEAQMPKNSVDSKLAELKNKMSMVAYYDGSKKKFSAMKYSKFAAQNKMISWSIYYLMMVAGLLLIANIGFGLYQEYSKNSKVGLKQLPEVMSNIKKIETNTKEIQQRILEARNQIETEFKKIPTDETADQLTNKISELFENGRLKIVKQEINENSFPMPVAFALPPMTKPEADQTIFSKIEIPLETETQNPVAKKTEKKDIGEKLTGKDRKTGNKTTVKTKKEVTAATPAPVVKIDNDNYSELVALVKDETEKKKKLLQKSLPKDVTFMSYHFQIKGQYLDYLQARNQLVKSYPYLNIPVEEIVSIKNQTDLEFRVIYDIPIIKKKSVISDANKTQRKGT